DRAHYLGQAIILERQGQLARLDLGEIEHVIDQRQEMPAVVLDALEHTLRTVRQYPVDAVDQQFGIAEDRVQRCSELVAHISEELRFVLAWQRQLFALVGNLAEQPRVLDRQYRLARQGLHQSHGLGWNPARLLPHQE